MKTVYLVVRFEESPYDIEGAFSTKELAEKYIAECDPEGRVISLDVDALKEAKIVMIHAVGLRILDGRVEWKSEYGEVSIPGRRGKRALVNHVGGASDWVGGYAPSEEQAMEIAQKARELYLKGAIGRGEVLVDGEEWKGIGTEADPD